MAETKALKTSRRICVDLRGNVSRYSINAILDQDKCLPSLVFISKWWKAGEGVQHTG